VTFHGLDAVYPNSVYQRRIGDNLKNNIDAVIAVSGATADECLKRGAGRGKVHVAPNGVDLSLKNIAHDRGFLKRLEERVGIPLKGKKILVSTGRGVKRKGFSWFLNNVLPRLDSGIVYIMAGPQEKSLGKKLFLMSLLPAKISRQIWLTGMGIDQAEIGKALKRPELALRAFHLGKIPFADLTQLLKSSYAFIMPNIHIDGDAEGFGVVALEAAMCGTAVLASNIEGIAEAVHDGKNGILIEAENEESWVKAVNELCGSQSKRKKIASAAPLYTAKRFSWDKMAAAYLKILKGL
jgi:phosphatidylinositol alpha-1,6-mannosyltransferase